MKNWKTTTFGALAGLALVCKPILDGSGYHFDTKTICEIAMASVIFLGGYFAKDSE